MQINRAHKVRPGFTLVELVAVIAVLAVLASVAIPKFADHSQQAKISAARGARAALADAIQHYYMTELANGRPGAYPNHPEDALQLNGSERRLNPWHVSTMPVFHINRASPTKLYPSQKTIERAARSRWGSIWYNPRSGSIRLRVPDQGSSSATLELFNLVNQTECTRINQTRP